MGTKQIAVPHIGDFTDVAIIEVYIKEGDLIDVEDPLIALESAKAVTDIPSPFKGKITKVFIKEGDLVSEGSLLADIEVDQETLAEVKTEELPSPPISEAKKEEPKQAEIELP
ncbi:MAG: biotin/lipoyl-containing protein, partial [Sphaerochaetaceae bacterium]